MKRKSAAARREAIVRRGEKRRGFVPYWLRMMADVDVDDVLVAALDALWTDVLQTMDWRTRPQLYVTQTPNVNAGAVGFGDPFVVINSASIEHLTRDELRAEAEEEPPVTLLTISDAAGKEVVPGVAVGDFHHFARSPELLD